MAKRPAGRVLHTTQHRHDGGEGAAAQEITTVDAAALIVLVHGPMMKEVRLLFQAQCPTDAAENVLLILLRNFG